MICFVLRKKQHLTSYKRSDCCEYQNPQNKYLIMNPKLHEKPFMALTNILTTIVKPNKKLHHLIHIHALHLAAYH